jgi:hypothetical protein
MNTMPFSLCSARTIAGRSPDVRVARYRVFKYEGFVLIKLS